MVLHCAAVGVPTPTISWLKNNIPLQNSNRITVTIKVCHHVRKFQTVLDSGFYAADSEFQALDSSL